LNAVDAAAQGGTPLLTFALVVAAIVIFILGSLVWWFLKERIQMTHRRLNAGNERFEKLEEKADRVEDSTIEIRADYIHKKDCQEYRDRRDQVVDKLNRTLERNEERFGELDKKLSGMCGEVRQGFKTVNQMLSSMVSVGTTEEP